MQFKKKKYNWQANLIPLSPLAKQLPLHISSMLSCNMVGTVSKREAGMCSHFRWHHSTLNFVSSIHFLVFPPVLICSSFFRHPSPHPLGRHLRHWMSSCVLHCMTHCFNLRSNNRMETHQPEWISCTSCCLSNYLGQFFLIRLWNRHTARAEMHSALLHPSVACNNITVFHFKKWHEEKQRLWGENQGPVVWFSHFFLS